MTRNLFLRACMSLAVAFLMFGYGVRAGGADDGTPTDPKLVAAMVQAIQSKEFMDALEKAIDKKLDERGIKKPAASGAPAQPAVCELCHQSCTYVCTWRPAWRCTAAPISPLCCSVLLTPVASCTTVYAVVPPRRKLLCCW